MKSRDSQIQDTLSLADKQLKRFKFTNAFSTYSSVFELTNQYPRINIPLARAHIGRGDVYFNLGEFDSALKSYEQALVLNPNHDKKRLSYLKNAYLKCASACLEKSDKERAIGYYIQAYILDPHCAEAIAALSKQVSHHHPLFSIVKMMLNDRHNGEAHVSLIEYFTQSRQEDRALFCAERFLKTNPDCVKALLVAAEFKLNIGLDHDMVISYCDKVISLNPTIGKAYLMRADAFLEKDDLLAASTGLVNLLKINLQGLFCEKSVDKVREYAEMIVSQHPHCADAYYVLGVVACNQGDLKAAMNHTYLALSIAERKEFHLLLGIIFFQSFSSNHEAKYHYEAIKFFEKALSRDKNYVPALMGLADLYEQSHLYNKALEYYKRALDLDGLDTEIKAGHERMNKKIIESAIEDVSVRYLSIFSKANMLARSSLPVNTHTSEPKKKFK